MAVPISWRRPRTSLIFSRACSWSTHEQLIESNQSYVRKSVPACCGVLRPIAWKYFPSQSWNWIAALFHLIIIYDLTFVLNYLPSIPSFHHNRPTHQHKCHFWYLLSLESSNHIRSASQITLGPANECFSYIHTVWSCFPAYLQSSEIPPTY